MPLINAELTLDVGRGSAAAEGCIGAQPSYAELHRMGCEVSRHFEPVALLKDLAAEIGTTKQGAYHESMVVLGKFCYRLRDRFISAPGAWSAAI